MTKFKSPFSNAMLVSTILVCLLLVFALYMMIVQIPRYSYTSFTFWGIILGICILVWTILYAFSRQIKEVSVTDTDLIIKKMCGSIIIPIKDIERVTTKENIHQDIRVCGISGLFGHIGWFINKQNGSYFALVKDGDSMLAIKKKNNKNYVISCDDRNQVINLLK